MTAQSKVEMVWTSDDAKAFQSAAKLLDKVREMGGDLDKTGKRGRDGFENMSRSVMGVVASLGSASGAMRMMMDQMELIREKIEAIRRENERGAEASKTYGEAFGRIVSNVPGITKPEATSIDQQIREIASQRALGEGGLVKLADAYAQVQTAIPLAPQHVKMAALTEAAEVLELSPTEDASGLALGIGKIMEQSGYAYPANQAQNLLRMQQTLGLVKSVAPIGQGIPKLGAAATAGQTTLADMQAFAAWMTQALGDTTGDESVTTIQSMTAQLMTRAGDVEKRTGIRPTGDIFERIGQIREKYQAGEIDEDTLGQLFPVISRGGAGKMAVLRLLGEGFGDLQDYRRRMTAPDVVQGDFTAGDISTLREALPAQEFQARRRQFAGGLEIDRAANVEAAQEVFYRERFEKTMERDKRTARFKEAALREYDLARYIGHDPDNAERIARVKGAGSDVAHFSVMGTEFNNPMQAIAKSSQQILIEIRDAIRGNGVERIPKRNLETGLDR